MTKYERVKAWVEWIKPYARNRYIAVAFIAVVWMLFFDRYDMRTRLKVQARIDKLEQDKAFYQKEIAKLKLERDLLQNNIREVERVAREQYLMKRPNEDVYVVVLDSTKKD